MQPADLRRQNLSTILQTLRLHGPLSRAELSDAVGLGPGSVTKLTAELIAAGVLCEQPSVGLPRSTGRPRTPVAVDGSRLRAVGVHIGLLRTKIGIFDLHGQVVTERELPHRTRDPETVIRLLVAALHELIDPIVDRVVGIGMSLGGSIDPDTDVVREHAFLEWRDVPIGDRVAAELGLPVAIESTVRALALAEHGFGRSVASPSLLHVFVGNIVGAALLVDGVAHVGPSSADSDVAHLPTGYSTSHVCSCGRDDCLQASASDIALVEDARAAGLLDADGRYGDLLAASSSGVTRATELLQERARRVGAALALLVEVLDPHLVVVAGAGLEDPTVLPHLRAGVADHVRRSLALPAEELVVGTSFGEQAPMFASAALILDVFYRRPSDLPPLAASTGSSVERSRDRRAHTFGALRAR